MTHNPRKRSTHAITVLVLYTLLVLSACTPPTTTGTTTPESSEATAAATEESEPTLAPQVFGPGSFNLPSPLAGLADLSSYTATLTRSFEGTAAGQPANWSRTYVMHADQWFASRQLTIEPEGDDTLPFFAAEVNGALYQRHGEDVCDVTVSEEANYISDRWEPAGYLSSVIGAEPAGSESVNGVMADHYTFDERAIGAVDVADATGEVWIASEGGYVIRYVLATEGGADFFGEDTEGTATVEYELTEVNQPITIELPADCPAGLVDAPLLPDAADVVNVPGLINYTTPSTVADAAAFYQEQLASLGWQPLDVPQITETDAIMEFTQGDQQLSVLVFTNEGVTHVLITLGPIPIPATLEP